MGVTTAAIAYPPATISADTTISTNVSALPVVTFSLPTSVQQQTITTLPVDEEVIIHDALSKEQSSAIPAIVELFDDTSELTEHLLSLSESAEIPEATEQLSSQQMTPLQLSIALTPDVEPPDESEPLIHTALTTEPSSASAVLINTSSSTTSSWAELEKKRTAEQTNSTVSDDSNPKTSVTMYLGPSDSTALVSEPNRGTVITFSPTLSADSDKSSTGTTSNSVVTESETQHLTSNKSSLIASTATQHEFHQLLASVLDTNSIPITSTTLSNSVSESSNSPAQQLGEQLLDTLRQQVSLQLTQQTQQATIRLDPAHLGQLEIAIRLDGEKLTVQINAEHTSVRESLQSSREQLRQLLTVEHGSNVNVDIGQHSSTPQQHQQTYALWKEPAILSANAITTDRAASVSSESATTGDWLNTVV